MKSLLHPPPIWRRLQLSQQSRIVVSSPDQVPTMTRVHSISTRAAPPTRSILISFQRQQQPILRAATSPVAAVAACAPRQIQKHPQRFFHLPNISAFLAPSNGNGNGNNGNNDSDGRVLRATRTLPFAPAPLFEVVSSVESYSEFLPFLTASTVTARDPTTGYPTRAFLTVGYGPFSETFT